jgi:hypothetical protein
MVATGCADIIGVNKLEEVDALAPTGFCATAHPAHLFCADFDESADVTSGWDASHASHGATLDLDTQQSKTPPASLYSSVPAAGGKDATATLEETITVPAPNGLLVVDFDVLVAAGDSKPKGTVQLVGLGLGAGGSQVGLVWTAGGPSVVVTVPSKSGGDSTSYPLEPVPAAGEWSHVEIDLGLATGEMGSLVVKVGTATALKKEAIPTGVASKKSVALTLGVALGSTPAAFAANFDDLTVDFY